MFDLLGKLGITYRDADHHYSRFGVKLDSVTGCLPYLLDANEYLANNPKVIEKAGVRGHRVADFIEQMEQFFATDNEGLGAYPQAGEECAERSYVKFKRETGFTALKFPEEEPLDSLGFDDYGISGSYMDEHPPPCIASELFVYHDILDYVGRLDLCGYAPNTALKGPGLIEVKATAVLPKTVGPQSAAYFEAFNRCAKLYDLPKLKWRASLHLTAKGYKFLPLTDPLDWPRFSSCLTATRWARELGFELEWKPIDKSGVSPMGETPEPSEVFA